MVYLLTLFMGLFLPTLASPAEVANQASRQALVILQEKVDAQAEFKQALPQEFRIVIWRGALVIVRADHDITDSDLEKLGRLPGVVAVRRDSSAYYPQEKKDAAASPGTCTHAPGAPLDQAPCLTEITQAVQKSVLKCGYTQICPDNLRPKLWGQTAIDGDLMLEEVKRIGITSGSVNAAVVDSGFDASRTKDFLNPSLVVKQGFAGASDPEHDKNGHGTMVSSLLGGKDGIGLAPDANLTVYSSSFGHGPISLAYVLFAIEKACAEGNEVINVSIGGMKRFEETPLLSPQTSTADKEFVARLGRRGCLLVNAAGNSGAQDFKKKTYDPEDALLTVQATSDNGIVADFSSWGEVSVPGDMVFTLTSSEAKPEEVKDEYQKVEHRKKICGNDSGKFDSGTSLSAPLMAAVMSNVVAILKKSPHYKSLQGLEKISLLNRIAHASKFAGIVNGLRAVLIAEQWVSAASSGKKNHTSGELADLLRNPPASVCSQNLGKKCLESNSCDEESKCVRKARMKIKLCEPMEAASFLDVIDVALLNDDPQSAAGLVQSLHSVPNAPVAALSSQADRIWNAYLERWKKQPIVYYKSTDNSAEANSMRLSQNLDVAQSIALLPYYFKSKPQDESGEKAVGDALSTLHSSTDLLYQFDDILPYRKELSNQAVESYVSFLHRILGDRGASSFNRQMRRLLDNTLKATNYSSSERIGTVGLFSILLSDKRFESVREQLLSLDKDLYEGLTKSSIGVRDSRKQLFPQVMVPFMVRHADRLRASIRKTIESGKAEGLGEAQIEYALLDPDFLKKDEKAELVLALLQGVANQPVSSINAFNERNIRFYLYRAYTDGKKQQKKLESILTSATNIDLMKLCITPVNSLDKKNSKSMPRELNGFYIELNYQENPIFTPNLRVALVKSLVQKVTAADADSSSWQSVVEFNVMETLIPVLAKNKNLASELDHLIENRILEHIDYQTCLYEPKPECHTRYGTRDAIEVIAKYLAAEKSQKLPPRPKSKAAYQKLKALAEEHANWFSQEVLDAAAKIVGL